MNSEPQLPPPIPEYELLNLIGRGSHGDVWLARGLTGVYRAIKVVWRDRFPSDDPYLREFRGLMAFDAISLTERSQLALLHVGRNEPGGFFYYVMEAADDAEGRSIEPGSYVPHTLAEARRRRGYIPAHQAVAIATELAGALAGLHFRGLIHGDIKPSNVIFVGGRAKLADIGSVVSALDDEPGAGTPGFAPNEGPGSTEADVFSLGILLYEILTGEDRRRFPRLPADFNLRPDCAMLLRLNEVVTRATHPQPARRFPDAGTLLQELRALQQRPGGGPACRPAFKVALFAALTFTGLRSWDRLWPPGGRDAEISPATLTPEAYASGIARSQLALQLGDLARARRELEALRPGSDGPDLRGFEWQLLLGEAQEDASDRLPIRTQAINHPSFSPDSRLLALDESADHTGIWDVAARQRVATLDAVHRNFGFSSDGEWLIGLDSAGQLRRWSVRTTREDVVSIESPGLTQAVPGLNNEVIGFLAGNNQVQPALVFWDLGTGREVSRVPFAPADLGIEGRALRAAAIVISADRRTATAVISGGAAGQSNWGLVTIDLPSREMRGIASLDSRPCAVALSPDGSHCALAMNMIREIQVYRCEDGSPEWRHSTSASAITSLGWSADGRWIGAGGDDHRVYLLEASTGTTVGRLQGHPTAIRDLAWSPDTASFVSIGTDDSVRFWNSLENREDYLPVLPPRPPSVTPASLQLSADGTRLAVGRTDLPLTVFSSDSLQALGQLTGSGTPLGFDRTSNVLALMSEGGLAWWSESAGVNPWPLPWPAADSDSLVAAYASSQAWLVLGGNDGLTSVWDYESGERIRTFAMSRTSPIRLIDVSESGELIAALDASSRLRLWRTQDGSLRGETRPANGVAALRLSPRGRLLATELTGGDVEIRSVDDLSHPLVVPAGPAGFGTLTFSPDERRLVIGGTNGLLYVFDTATGQELAVLSVSPDSTNGDAAVDSVTFSEDGRTLAASLANGAVRVWKL